MNPSDTHISRMASTFAERSPYLRTSREAAEATWKEALEFGREEGLLTQIEQHLVRRGVDDPITRDVWTRAKEY